MADYISREECIKDLREYEKTAFSGLTVIGCMSRIKRIPAADVRPVVRGTWVPTRKYDYYYKCSVCNKIGPLEPDAESAFQYDYCPNCGADMRPNLDTTKGDNHD